MQQGQKQPGLPVFHAQLLVGTDFLGLIPTRAALSAKLGFACGLVTWYETHYIVPSFCSQGYCELSDIEMRDLRPNQDYIMDQQFLMYAWDLNAANCFSPIPPPGLFTPVNSCKHSVFDSPRFVRFYRIIVSYVQFRADRNGRGCGSPSTVIRASLVRSALKTST